MLSHQLKGFKGDASRTVHQRRYRRSQSDGRRRRLALDGKIPWATTFAALRRCAFPRAGAQRHRLPGFCRSRSWARWAASAAGRGPTHAGMEDLGTMRMMPGMTVIAPATRSTSRSSSSRPTRPAPSTSGSARNDPIIYPKGSGRRDRHGDHRPGRLGRDDRLDRRDAAARRCWQRAGWPRQASRPGDRHAHDQTARRGRHRSWPRPV